METKMDNNKSTHEDVSSELLRRRFYNVGTLIRYLEKSGIEYILKEDFIAKESPKTDDIFWNPKDGMYYLVLLPRNPKKLYRFRVYVIAKDRLHLESDFAYQNPYQQ
jgi:hypothetical protein